MKTAYSFMGGAGSGYHCLLLIENNNNSLDIRLFRTAHKNHNLVPLTRKMRIFSHFAHLQFLLQQAGNLRPHKKLTQTKPSTKPDVFIISLTLPELRGINIDYEKHNNKSCERMTSLCCRAVLTDVAQL